MKFTTGILLEILLLTLTIIPSLATIDVCSFEPSPNATLYRIVILGDFGDASTNESDVAKVVNWLQPHIIVSMGDNNYYNGSNASIDINVGQFYSQYIYPYNGIYGSGEPTKVNRFFPTPGNHDWGDAEGVPISLDAYLWYFTLPGNGRYYDFTCGSAHFFSLDNDPSEPDGNAVNSTQHNWFMSALNASTSAWQIAYMHFPPYSSSIHGPNTYAQWNYEQYGIDVVLAGHDHTYERIERPYNGPYGNTIPYIVQGAGGHSISPIHVQDQAYSMIQYNTTYSCTLMEITADTISMTTFGTAYQVIDRRIIRKPVPAEETIQTVSYSKPQPPPASDKGKIALIVALSIALAIIIILLFVVLRTNVWPHLHPSSSLPATSNGRDYEHADHGKA